MWFQHFNVTYDLPLTNFSPSKPFMEKLENIIIQNLIMVKFTA